MTMSELAKMANVSVSTVSKAFKNAEDVSKETREHIFSLARQYGCYGKFYKGKYSKKIIAVICPELVSDFYVAYVERLQQLIEQGGGIAVISAYHFNYSKQEELIEYYASYLQVDGIFVIGLKRPLKRGYDIPVISLFPENRSNTDSVSLDYYSPIFDAVELLKNKGHKQIAFFSEPLTASKAEMFNSAVESVGSVNGFVVTAEARFEQAGKECVKQLLQRKSECTAIICAYDYIAIGAVKQLKREGYSVPRDFSVIGIDNINFAEHMETSLTTIDTNADEICRICWDLMQKKLNNSFFKSYQCIRLKGRLVLRESVCEARAGDIK